MGGYFEFERFYGTEYHNDLLRFDSVRSSFIFLVKQRQYRKIYLPYYLCGCIEELLCNYHILYEFYHIDREFKPIFDKEMKQDECLFFVNYFGQFSNDELLFLKEKWHNIFVDNTQSFFQKPANGLDTAYSCRKYFGVSDGAYLSSDLTLHDEYENLSIDVSHEKLLYVMGRFETSANKYYETFVENEKICRGRPIKRMSLLNQNILKGIDYQRILQRRNQNFDCVDNRLKKINKLEIRNKAGLFFYPFYIKNGSIIRKNLIERKVYIPVLWPNVLTDVPEHTIEYSYSNDIVFLPIDQRYDVSDMEYMLQILEKHILGE
jgi:hypothetical protein